MAQWDARLNWAITNIKIQVWSACNHPSLVKSSILFPSLTAAANPTPLKGEFVLQVEAALSVLTKCRDLMWYGIQDPAFKILLRTHPNLTPLCCRVHKSRDDAGVCSQFGLRLGSVEQLWEKWEWPILITESKSVDRRGCEKADRSSTSLHAIVLLTSYI